MDLEELLFAESAKPVDVGSVVMVVVPVGAREIVTIDPGAVLLGATVPEVSAVRGDEDEEVVAVCSGLEEMVAEAD